VSARQAALKRWAATDKRWNKNVVSRGSVVASVKRLPICVNNSWVLTLMGPNVSSATEKKSWVPLSGLYLFLFLTAAVSAALALVMTLCCRLVFPRMSTTATSQVALRPEFHGNNVKPSGRLPSSRTRPCGSVMLGTPAQVKARQIRHLCSCDVVFCWSCACKKKRKCRECRKWHHTDKCVTRRARNQASNRRQLSFMPLCADFLEPKKSRLRPSKSTFSAENFISSLSMFISICF